MNFWEGLKPHIGCLYNRLALSTVADLDAFEARHGFPLPASYRQFALAFGIGAFTAEFAYTELVMPGFSKMPPCCDPYILGRHARDTHGKPPEDSRLAAVDDLPRLLRLVFFATKYTIDFWGWDPQDVTDASAGEYGIYQFLKHNERISRVATSFPEFILNHCCQGQLRPDDPAPSPDLRPDDYAVKFNPARPDLAEDDDMVEG